MSTKPGSTISLDNISKEDTKDSIALIVSAVYREQTILSKLLNESTDENYSNSLKAMHAVLGLFIENILNEMGDIYGKSTTGMVRSDDIVDEMLQRASSIHGQEL